MSTSISKMTAEILAAYEWTEADLARRIGCSQGHVNRIKRGRVKRPNYEVGVAIADLHAARPTAEAA